LKYSFERFIGEYVSNLRKRRVELFATSVNPEERAAISADMSEGGPRVRQIGVQGRQVRATRNGASRIGTSGSPQSREQGKG